MQLAKILEKISPRSIKHYIRRHIFPYKETKIFVNKKTLPIITKKISTIVTASQPKQVVVDSVKKIAYVSCMKGRCIQKFSFEDGYLKLLDQINFDDQCVEVEIINNLLYATTTNFLRKNLQKSYLRIIDLDTFKIVSSTDTQGAWSKVIKIDQEKNICYISNWHSNNITVMDITNKKHPKVVSLLQCKESPRGLGLLPNGDLIACNFYGKTVIKIGNIDGNFIIKDESNVFDKDTYGGNLRDILISRDGNKIYISNLGRNMIITYNSNDLTVISNTLITREPNSIRFFDSEKYILASSRKDNIICVIDLENNKVIGRSEETDELPTGLEIVDSGFLVTNFNSNTMELHRFTNHVTLAEH